jgi:hypothetical protein
MRSLFRVRRDLTGNLPPMPDIFPDYPAPIVRMAEGQRELAMAPATDALAGVFV